MAPAQLSTALDPSRPKPPARPAPPAPAPSPEAWDLWEQERPFSPGAFEWDVEAQRQAAWNAWADAQINGRWLPQRQPSALWAPELLSPPAQQGALALATAAEAERLASLTVRYGVDSGQIGVAGGATAVISVTPQKPHRPERLVLSEAVSNVFVIADIRAGVDPVLATTGAISAAEFVPNSNSPPFNAVDMPVGKTFSVAATNTWFSPARFICNVIGIEL